MLSTAQIKTTGRQFDVGWPTEGDARDFKFWGAVGEWIQKNEKVLGKKCLVTNVKLLHEQFPTLTRIDVRDYSGRGASL